MYPVDAIKVRSQTLRIPGARLLTRFLPRGTDPNADCEPHTFGDVFWYCECRCSNIIDRGRQVIVEGDCQCGFGGWYVFCWNATAPWVRLKGDVDQLR